MIEPIVAPQPARIPLTYRFWRSLFGPSRAVTEPEARRQSQLLASLMLGLVLSGLGIMFVHVTWVDPDYVIHPMIVIGFGVMSLLYAVSRSKYYRAAAWLAVISISIAIFVMGLIRPQYVPPMTLSYLLVSVLLASIFLSFRGTSLVATVNVLGLLALSALGLGSWPSLKLIVAPLSFLMMTSILIVVSQRHRDLLEQDRQMALRNANEALQDSLQRWQSVVENAPATIILVGLDRTIQFINLDLAIRDQVVGKSVFEFVPESEQEALRSALGQVFERGENATYELAGMPVDGSLGWFSTIAAPIWRDGRVVGATLISADITKRKQAEEALQRVNAELELRVVERTEELVKLNDGLQIELGRRKEAEGALRTAKDEMEQQNARLTALYHIGQVVNSTLMVEEILTRLIDEAMRVTRATHGQVLLVDPAAGRFRRRALRGFSPAETVLAQATPLPLPEGINGHAYRSRKIYCVDDVQKEAGYFALISSTRTEVAVPIIYSGQVVGNLDLQSPEIGAFRDADLDYLAAMADQAAVAIANAQLYERAQQEIQERRRTEIELQQITDALKHSNDELQQFAYVASHDLQEPLRMVASYVQLLEHRYKGRLDADADDFIGFAVDGANRMKTLINDLLAYSRIGTRGKPLEPAECQDALEQALTNLQIAIQEGGATITHDPLPKVLADEIQLVQVFQNLIGNAIKFRDLEPPRIHISAEEQEHEWRLSVRDNGIGIDPQYAERIFVIFQRLHTRGQYPGTGIGLAVCRKIVERHGGRIWVESKAGGGATFHFTLPKPQHQTERATV